MIELIHQRVQGRKCSDILRILIHELLHIPKTFSGSLRSHGEWSRASNINKYWEKLDEKTREKICQLIGYAINEAGKYKTTRYALR